MAIFQNLFSFEQYCNTTLVNVDENQGKREFKQY